MTPAPNGTGVITRRSLEGPGNALSGSAAHVADRVGPGSTLLAQRSGRNAFVLDLLAHGGLRRRQRSVCLQPAGAAACNARPEYCAGHKLRAQRRGRLLVHALPWQLGVCARQPSQSSFLRDARGVALLRHRMCSGSHEAAMDEAAEVHLQLHWSAF